LVQIAIFAVFLALGSLLAIEDARHHSVGLGRLLLFFAVSFLLAACPFFFQPALGPTAPVTLVERSVSCLVVLFVMATLFVASRGGMGGGDVLFALALAPHMDPWFLPVAYLLASMAGLLWWGVLKVRGTQKGPIQIPLFPFLWGAHLVVAFSRPLLETRVMAFMFG
jgi:hypothetical protein